MKFLASIVSLVLLSLSGISYGTTLQGISQKQLVQEADLIVHVTPLTHSSHWRRGRIYTHYNVRVTEYLLGQGPAELNIELLGGEVNGIAQTVSGVPQMPLQEPKLLFLKKAPDRRAFTPIRLGLGIYRYDDARRYWSPSTHDLRVLGETPKPVVLDELRKSISTLRGHQ